MERERVDSEKTLRRAAQTLNSLHDCEVRLHAHLAELGAAIGQARERQEAHAGTVAQRAAYIAQRTEALRALLTRWKVLGEEAMEVSRLVQDAAAVPPTNGDAANQLTGTCEEVDERLSRLAEEADELSGAAAAAAFADLAKQAEGLRQQVLSARNKVRLARKS